ncbi:MAG: hydrogenase accessory protein HypB, partial [Lachnospiraceae bacterium]|nr:hydrogenase accessory protein HypB [Lachnospiraceae bacterium]
MNVEIFETKERLLADNDSEAEKTRLKLRESGTFFVNLMGSPGAGKTSVLLRLLPLLSGSCRIGVMEADVDSDVDAKAVSDAGA